MRNPLRTGLLFWVISLAALVFVRVPYLTSPLYILDNDEAVLGIMARHMAAGTDFPLYFEGQSYGLAIFETLPLALSFTLFGESTAVVALTIFAPFAIGLSGLARALANLSGSDTWGRALAITLVLVPGWIVWSMKARGIYVSDFALSALALALLTGPRPSRRDLLGSGLSMGLVGWCSRYGSPSPFPSWRARTGRSGI